MVVLVNSGSLAVDGATGAPYANRLDTARPGEFGPFFRFPFTFPEGETLEWLNLNMTITKAQPVAEPNSLGLLALLMAGLIHARRKSKTQHS